MISEPTYTLIAHTTTGIVDLGSFTRATCELDETRSPHVTATVVIAWSDALPLTILDPRAGTRVVITVTDGSTVRVFDLGLRERSVDHSGAEVTLRLASDEALLADYAPLADDYTPLSFSSSVRDITEYVIGQAIPGATLEAAPAVDANATPYWSVTNLQRNPAVVDNTNNWSAGGGVTLSYVPQSSSGVVRAELTASSGSVFMVDTTKYNVNGTPGDTYNASVSARCEVPFLSGETARLVLRFLDNNNATITNIVGPAIQMQSGEYRRLKVSGRAPANTAKLAPYVSINGSAAGRAIILDAALLYEGDPLLEVAPFTGADAPSDGYTYSFQGEPYDSPSVRNSVVERDPEALIWQAGQSGIDFLRPLLQSKGLRLVCDEHRQWTLRDEDYSAPGSVDIRHGVNLISGDDSIDRDDDSWFDARVTVYRWRHRISGIEERRIDAYALTTPYTRLSLLELDDAYPGPGRSEYAVRRAQTRGREVSATAVADWSAQAEQSVTVRLKDAPTQLGSSIRVSFDLEQNTMSILTRTKDVDAYAWIFGDEGAWTTGPVGESWTEAA